MFFFFFFFFFNDTATTEIYTLSLHDALPTSPPAPVLARALEGTPNLLSALAAAGGHSDCVVAARQFGFTIFSYTGYRLVGMGGTGHPGNGARIRWKDIYQ